MNPVTPPANATAYLDLEQQPGWEKDATVPDIGPCAPAVYDIVQEMPAPIQPPMTMTLRTTGVKGKYCDWMAKKTVNVKPGQVNCLIRASYTFDSVTGIQAWELGRRKTDQNRITDNGQTQLVPIAGNLLEFDIVPSSKGGWKDTGIRFPMFEAGVAYEQELYYVNNADGALSLIYISLNGVLFPIPAALQHIAGANLDWAANEAVAAFQPDANPTAIPFNPQVTMSVWFW